MLVSGGVIVASNVLAYTSVPRGGRFGTVDLLHFALPVAIYCLVNFAMDDSPRQAHDQRPEIRPSARKPPASPRRRCASTTRSGATPSGHPVTRT